MRVHLFGIGTMSSLSPAEWKIRGVRSAKGQIRIHLATKPTLSLSSSEKKPAKAPDQPSGASTEQPDFVRPQSATAEPHLPAAHSSSNLAAISHDPGTETSSDVAWRSACDPESGDHYYYNLVTGETTWDPPEGIHPREAELLTEQVAQFDQSAPCDPPLPSDD
eukprot:6068890-Pleurochrysis_carterae.AAC.2